MGFTPQEVGRMTLWEFMACLEGVAMERGWRMSGPAKELSDDDLREMGIVGFE